MFYERIEHHLLLEVDPSLLLVASVVHGSIGGYGIVCLFSSGALPKDDSEQITVVCIFGRQATHFLEFQSVAHQYLLLLILLRCHFFNVF